MGRPKNLGMLPLAALILAAGPEPFTVALPPGPTHDAIARILLKPYADATDTPQSLAPFDGSLDGLTSLSGPQLPDLALVSGAVLAAGCARQDFARLDWSGLQRAQYQAFAATDCGAGVYIEATVVAYDQDKLHGDPSWGDFWDVAKYPGRRGLRKTARGTLEIALMADGVSPQDVYRTLRTQDGLDRAFRKLDQLKPYVEWWESGASAGQALAAGKVLLTAAPANTLPIHRKLRAGVHWGGCVLETVSWAVPKNAVHGEAALIAMQIAADPARQAEFAEATGLGPATKIASDLLPAPAQDLSPALPAHLQACLVTDEGFWLENGDKLQARFAAWVGK